MAQRCISLFPSRKSNLILSATRKLSTFVSSSEKIVIPKRIPRSKTDILEALSATVGTDPTAPAYQYMDDPFLIPNNRHQKLIYSLSKDSGRNAAKFFMDKFPHLFIRDESEPKIEAFHFKELFDESMDLTEEDLLHAINNNQVDNAITAFNTIQAKKGNLSDSAKKSLLELVCYFNSLEVTDPDSRGKFIMERPPKSIWVSDFAFDVFNSLSEKDGLAYSIMLAGLCKHSAYERALQLHQEVKEKRLALTIEGYNGLIGICSREQSFENRWSAMMDIINEMNSHNIAPNVITFANMMEILASSKSTREVKDMARGVMTELKRCKIFPCLSIYCDLLKIFTAGANPKPRILEQILDELGTRKLTMRHENDIYFFSLAMAICTNNLADVKLAYRLHDLVCSHQNVLLLGPMDLQNRYYNNLFKLIIKSEPIDQTMKMYYKYIPNMYIPDTSTMSELIDTIELYQADRYIPQVCSDFILFELLYSPAFTVKFLDTFSRRVYSQEIQSHLCDTVMEILKFTESKLANSRMNDTLNFNVSILDSCLRLTTISKDFVKAQKVFQLYRSAKNALNGTPSIPLIKEFVDLAITDGTRKDLVEATRTACTFGDSSIISKLFYLCRKGKINPVLLERLEDIRGKTGAIIQEIEDDSESSSSSSSDSSDEDNKGHLNQTGSDQRRNN